MTFGEIRFRLTKLCAGVDADSLDGFINDAYESILDRTGWKLLEADDHFVTVAPYAAGTIALTAGALTFIGTGTVFTADMTGMGVSIPGRSESYRFNYTDPTHGALDRAFEGGTAAASAYRLYQDVYALPADFARPLVARNERYPGLIEFRDRVAMDRGAPVRITFGEPAFWSLVSPSPLLSLQASLENDRLRAKLYPIPNYAAQYPYAYVRTVPSFTEGDTETPVLPWVSTKALIDLARAAVEADRKNYTGAAYYTAAAEREISKMLIADSKVRGPQKLRMAGVYTRQNLARAVRGSTGARCLP